MLFHPEIYFKDCDECMKYIIADGKPVTTPDGKPIKRRAGEKPNCKMCDRSSITVLSDRNWLTYQMYLRHKHLGLEDFERRDPLVRRHMVMIGEIDEIARMRMNPMAGMFNG